MDKARFAIIIAMIFCCWTPTINAEDAGGFLTVNGSYGKYIPSIRVAGSQATYGQVNVLGGINTKYLKIGVGLGFMQTTDRFSMFTYLGNEANVRSKTIFISPALGIYSNFKSSGKIFPFIGIEYWSNLYTSNFLTSKDDWDELPLFSYKRKEIKHTDGFLKVTHSISERAGLGIKLDDQFSMLVGVKHTMFLNGFIYENPAGGKRNHFVGPFVSLMFNTKAKEVVVESAE